MTTHELINQLQMMYHGVPWYGDSMAEKLNKIEAPHFDLRISDSAHTIRELLEHMIAWRTYVIEKLDGNIAFDIKLDSDDDWKQLASHNGNGTSDLFDRLKTTQNKLVHKLKEKDDEWLYAQVPGKQYDNLTLLSGIIQHDIYHLGQIGLIHKLLQEQHNIPT